jgi:hypothetical protein
MRSALLLFRICKATCLLLGMGFVLLLVLEGSARVALRLVDSKPDSQRSQDRPKVYRSIGPGGLEWRPHVYWRARPRSGPNVNVDADGLRATWNPPDADETALRIHMFGASTLRGHGARDEFTIPSLVSKRIAESRVGPVRVTNFGQKAYSTTQDVLTLLFEIRSGNIPDIAVFYDGSLDIESSYDIHEAGSPRNEHLRRLPFEDPRASLKLMLLKRSSLAKLVLLYTPGWDWEIGGVWKPPASPAVFPKLADDTIDVYVSNLELARALGRAYGFEVLHFWQPVLWSKDPRNEFEQNAIRKEARKHPLKGELFEMTYDRIRTNSKLLSDPRFFDLQDVFDGVEVEPFFDTTHTTEAGNAIVADAITPAVLAAIERRRAEPEVGGNRPQHPARPASRERNPQP